VVIVARCDERPEPLNSEEHISDACHLFGAGILVLCCATLFLEERTSCCAHSQ